MKLTALMQCLEFWATYVLSLCPGQNACRSVPLPVEGGHSSGKCKSLPLIAQFPAEFPVDLNITL
jgi:hypothetical protein